MATEAGPRGIDQLLELQKLDLLIDRLTARRDELESGEDVRTARAALEAAENVLGEQKLALDSLDREQRRLEGDIDSLSRKADDEQKRMYDGSVVNPKELEAIQHEVESLKTRRGRIEDELLERMERREELDGRIAQAQAEATGARDRLAEVSGDSVHELEDIGKGLAEGSAERAQLVPAFDEELLELYDDLRRQKRGVGAAALVDGVCQGCHQKLSAMEMARLKKVQGVKRCEYCRMHQALQTVWSTIRILRRVRQHAVISPVAIAGELVDRHDLDRSDPQLLQRRQSPDGCVECAGVRERANVQFVDDQILSPHASPVRVGPFKLRWTHDC